MKVFLLKDVPNVGTTGQVKVVEDGFARNFLLPRKLVIEVTTANESVLAAKTKKEEQRKEIVLVKTSEMADKIKATRLVLKKKMHDDGKLYGSINATEIVEGLAREGINITPSKVEFSKRIKNKGNFEVVINLTSRLKSVLTVSVLPE